LEGGYCRIGEATNIDGWEDPKANVLQLVRSWLCDEDNGRWVVVVVNNADDPDVFLTRPREHLATLFSASFYDVSPANQGSKLSPWVWLCCIVTANLTAAVLFVWRGVFPDEAVQE
jgi:hypothetical protein